MRLGFVSFVLGTNSARRLVISRRLRRIAGFFKLPVRSPLSGQCCPPIHACPSSEIHSSVPPWSHVVRDQSVRYVAHQPSEALVLIGPKVCDLCYAKKIKCDLGKPSCANCIVYDVQCTHSAASRGQASGQPALGPSGEGQLSGQTQSSQLEPAPESSSQHHAQHGLPDLPLWSEVQSLVEEYLNGCNLIVPMLNSADVRVAYANWCARPEDRDAITWAQLNVVLALAFKTGLTGSISTSQKVFSHINNAQSVLSDLLACDVSLSTVRVVVGMVMLFQTMPDLRPATLLIATALRLAHELEMHTRSSHGPDPVLNAERDRVFWAAYLLDKDIGLRIRQPSIQLDADIDLDLPSVEPWDGAGFIFTADGQHSLHYFRERVRLSRIQGAVYDGIWSVRARKLAEDRRAENKATVEHALAEWEQSVPWAFGPGIFTQTAPVQVQGHLVKMHYEHASCLAFANGVDGFDLDSLRHICEEVARGVGLPLSLRRVPWSDLAGKIRQPMADFVIIPTQNAGLVW